MALKLVAQDAVLSPILKLIPKSATDEQIYFYIWAQDEAIAERVPVPKNRNEHCVEMVRNWIITDITESPTNYSALHKLRPLAYKTIHFEELIKYATNRAKIFTPEAIKKIQEVLGFTTPKMLASLLTKLKDYPVYQQYALVIAYFLYIEGAFYNKRVFINFICDGPIPPKTSRSARTNWAKWGNIVPRFTITNLDHKPTPLEKATSSHKSAYTPISNRNQLVRPGISINSKRVPTFISPSAKKHVEAERKQREEAEHKQREEAEHKQREEAEHKQREEAEHKQREEAEHKQCEEAEHKQREDTERKQREEAEHKQREEAERKQREETEHKQREETERKQREETECKQREEAEREKREEAEHKQREDTEREQREETERKRREEAERKQREEAEREKREETEREQREEAVAKKRREETERKQREEAVAKKQREEAERKQREEAVAKKRRDEEARAEQRRKASAAAKKQRKEDIVAQKRREEEIVAQRRQEAEAVARKHREEQAIAKKQEENIRKEREEEITRRREEERAKKIREDEAAAKKQYKEIEKYKRREEELRKQRETVAVATLQREECKRREEELRKQREEAVMARKQRERVKRPPAEIVARKHYTEEDQPEKREKPPNAGQQVCTSFSISYKRSKNFPSRPAPKNTVQSTSIPTPVQPPVTTIVPPITIQTDDDDDLFTIYPGPPVRLSDGTEEWVINNKPLPRSFSRISKDWYDSHPDLAEKDRRLQAWLEDRLINWLPLASDSTHQTLRKAISDIAQTC